MATKHTKGPWLYERQHKFFSVRHVRDDEWTVVCETLLYSPEDEANARLISAAPELLELLKSSLESLQMESECDGCTVYPCTQCRAKAVIRKAEGAL